MSRTAILSIKFSKEVLEIEEFGNSYGSAPVIWDALSQKYLDARPFGYDVEKLCPLYKSELLPLHHKAALMMTFDYAYVSRKNFKRAAEDIRKFLKDFPPVPGRVNHWSKIADIFEKEKCANIGICHTSVGENLFQSGNRAIAKSKCFEIYNDELDTP